MKERVKCQSMVQKTYKIKARSCMQNVLLIRILFRKIFDIEV